MEIMDVQSMSESEYDAQLFGFTVDDFMVAFRQLIEDEVSHYTSALASSLIKKYPDDDPEVELIKHITTSLLNKYIYKAEEPLKNLKALLKELLHIPPHVLLPEDIAQRTQYSAEEEQEVDDQLKDFFHQLKRAKAFKGELLQEMKMLQDVLPHLNKRVEELENLVTKQQKSEKAVEDLEPVIDKTVNQTKKILQFEDEGFCDLY